MVPEKSLLEILLLEWYLPTCVFAVNDIRKCCLPYASVCAHCTDSLYYSSLIILLKLSQIILPRFSVFS